MSDLNKLIKDWKTIQTDGAKKKADIKLLTLVRKTIEYLERLEKIDNENQTRGN